MKTFVIRLALGYVRRILAKEPDSLVRKCFEAHRQLFLKKGLEVRTFFSDLSQVLDRKEWMDVVLSSDTNPIDIVNLSYKITLIVSQSLQEADIAKMQESSSSSHYKDIKKKVGMEPYLDFELPWDMSRLYCQLRFGHSFFRFKNFSKFLGGARFKSENCVLCGKGLENDFHIMYQCPHYKCFRERYLQSFLMPSRFIEFRKFFLNFDVECIKQVYYFWTSVNRLRNFCIEEMG
jgi:hypothetical protein